MEDRVHLLCQCEYCEAKFALFREVKNFAYSDLLESERRVFLGFDCLESSPTTYGYEECMAKAHNLESTTAKTVCFIQELLNEETVSSVPQSFRYAVIVVSVLLFQHLKEMVERLLCVRASPENVRIFEQIYTGNMQHLALLAESRATMQDHLSSESCFARDVIDLTSEQ